MTTFKFTDVDGMVYFIDAYSLEEAARIFREMSGR